MKKIILILIPLLFVTSFVYSREFVQVNDSIIVAQEGNTLCSFKLDTIFMKWTPIDTISLGSKEDVDIVLKNRKKEKRITHIKSYFPLELYQDISIKKGNISGGIFKFDDTEDTKTVETKYIIWFYGSAMLFLLGLVFLYFANAEYGEYMDLETVIAPIAFVGSIFCFTYSYLSLSSDPFLPPFWGAMMMSLLPGWIIFKIVLFIAIRKTPVSVRRARREMRINSRNLKK